MSLVEFQKMHGLGNDFVIIAREDLGSRVLNCAQITQLANRKLGIGFDQLILIENIEPGLIHMQIFNEDGTEASFCGNGVRCVSGYLFAHTSSLESITIRTAGPRYTTCQRDEQHPNWVVARVGRASIHNDNIQVDFEGIKYTGVHLDLGNPHVVFFDDNKRLDLEKLYKSTIEKTYPDANLSLVEVLNRKEMRLRVWESGNGATMACGSAACASFYSALHRNLVDRDGVRVHFVIGHLELRLEGDDGDKQEIIMAGPYAHVFTGKICIP